MKEHFEIIFSEQEIGVSFEILYPHGAALIRSIWYVFITIVIKDTRD